MAGSTPRTTLPCCWGRWWRRWAWSKYPRTRIGRVVAFLLFVYFLVHTWATHAMQSREFYLSISYFALYAVFRVIKGMRLTNYAALAVLLCGIYQSYLVLEQLLGYRGFQSFSVCCDLDHFLIRGIAWYFFGRCVCACRCYDGKRIPEGWY